MSAEGAYLVVSVGMLLGLLTWGFALRLLLRQRRWPAVQDGDWVLLGTRSSTALADAMLLTTPRGRLSREDGGALLLPLGGCHARVEFRDRPGQVEMHAVLDWSRGARMFGFIMGLLVLVLQPAVILGLGGGLWHWVASSDSAEVRWMALQVVQIAHVLWPPFLVHYLYRKLRGDTRMVIEHLALHLGRDTPGAPAAPGAP